MQTITSTVEYNGNLRTTARHSKSGTLISTDAPTDNEGKGEWFSPTDILATSLASCMITIMGISARNHGLKIEGTKAEVVKHMAANPRRVSKIEIDLYFPKNEFSEKEKEILQRAALNCPVAKSLHPDIDQEIRFHF